MSLLLLIETATTCCSVALAQDNQVIALREIDQRNVHAEVITVFIGELFTQTGKQYTELDAVAVSCGPGSYTGLRIGVSTAKGLCYALSKPLIAIETLSAMAHGFIERGGMSIPPAALLCPMIDARRMEVYTALYTTDGAEVKPTSAEVINEVSYSDILAQQPVMFFGDGAEKCKPALGGNPNSVFAVNFTNSARDLLTPALNKLHQQDFADVAYFEPFYLKDFLAGTKKQ